MRRDHRRAFVVEPLEGRISLSITTSVVKVPGPTDLVVGTNPAGHQPPGQTDEIHNRDRKLFA